MNDWVNDEIEESPLKGKEIEANPNLTIDKVFDVLPVTLAKYFVISLFYLILLALTASIAALVSFVLL